MQTVAEERLRRLQAALWALDATLGHDDITQHDWRLSSHLALGAHRLRTVVQQQAKEVAAAALAPSVGEMARQMVELANAKATDTAGS